MSGNDPETGLAGRIGRGDHAAEEELVGRFQPRVYAMALARTRDAEVARDLAQDIMLALLRTLRKGELRDHESLESYVCVTARNRIHLYFRSRRIERETGNPATPDIKAIDPEKILESAERLRLALRVIEQLRPMERRILRLTLVEGMKPGEIAMRFGMTAEVVRARKSRALRKARKMLRRIRITKLPVVLLSYEELP